MKKNKNKLDWKSILLIILYIIIIIAVIAVIGFFVFLRIWVYMEYGDVPISEVPSWAIPYLR